MTGAISFLEAISGYVEDGRTSSADRPFRIATIDPAYDSTAFPLTLPQVTFDGESALTAKRYQCLSPYHPKKADRVLMAPAGHTYVILGSLSWVPWVPPVSADGTDITAITSTTPAAGSPVVGTTFTAPPSGRVWVNLSGGLYAEAASTEVILGWELRTGGTIGSGTVVSGYAANGDLGISTGRGITSQITTTRREPVSGLTPGSVYNVRTMHWVGVGTGRVTYRKLVIEPG